MKKSKLLRLVIGVLALTVLLLCPAQALMQDQTNLVKNPSFEQWDEGDHPDLWRMDAWITDLEASSFTFDTSATYSGVNSARIENVIPNDARLKQEFSINPGALYHISGWIKTKDVPQGEYGASISVADMYQQIPMVSGDTGDAWEFYEWYGRAGEDQTDLIVMARLGYYGNLVQGTAWFDDIAVEEVEAVPAGYEMFELSPGAVQGSTQDEGTTSQGFKAIFGIGLLVSAVTIALLIRTKRVLAGQPLSVSTDTEISRAFTFVLLGALALRLVLAVTTKGYEVDVNCFTQWGLRMASVGPVKFYAPDYFCDYPPGSIWLLGLQGLFVGLFGGEVHQPLTNLIMRLPAILSDLAIAALIFHWSRKRFGGAVALMLCALAAFNPTMIIDGAVWGQMDSVWVLILMLSLHHAAQKRYQLAAPLYMLALLVKPQALVLGPLVLFVVLQALTDKRDQQRFKKMLIALGASIAVLLVIALPFWIGTGRFGWLFELYGGTVGSYPYASLNAYNLFALIGGNWVDQSTRILGFSYQAWGTLLMGAVIIATGWLVLAKRRKDGLFLAGAFLIAGVFAVGPRMHERYLFPAIPLLLAAYYEHKDRRLLYVFGAFSITQFVNMLHVLAQSHIPANDIALRLLSLVNVLGFIWLCLISYQILVKGQAQPVKADEEAAKVKQPGELALGRLFEKRTPLKVTRKDVLLLVALTVVYAIIALVNLGQISNPETYFKSMRSGEIGTMTFAQPVNIRQVARYVGIGEGGMSLTAITDQGEQDLATITTDGWSMFKWTFDHVTVDNVTQVRFDVTDVGISVMEIAFFDEAGNQIPSGELTVKQGAWGQTMPAAMFDEPDQVPKKESYLNSMYFDEVYHARTAYEHINRIEPYEITHPPLGKILISIGIQLFGMNAFGWRIVGTVFGILMVPLMYLLALALFKKASYALMAAFIFTFDLMHFGQTRIATIDVYAVFFILLMYLFMAKYVQMNLNRDPLWKTFIPLGLSGISFGLGAASKWTCIYAGAGLAVLFFRSLYQRWRESVYAGRALKAGEYAWEDQALLSRASQQFTKKAILTLLFCIAFFIIIPLGIYVASYYPYMVAGRGHGLEVVWKNQQYMLNYHGGLVDSHPYASPWWEWPLMLRPIWYYMGTNMAEGMTSTINGMGNPIVWWGAFAAFVALVVRSIKGQKTHSSQTFVLIALASQFLPWVLVPRSTFIYHYFNSLPFMILILVYMLRLLWEGSGAHRRWVYVYLAAVVIVFALFYPMVSGIPIGIPYAKLLRWLPWWMLFS